MTFYKYKYVVKLLEPVPKEFRDKSGETSLKGKLKRKLYKWRPDFKYSTRVVCIYVVGFIGIYMILLIDCWSAMQLLQLRDVIVDGYVATVDTVREWLMIGVVSIFVAAGVAGIHSIILAANMLSWYRGHLLRLQRGEKDFLPAQFFNKNPSAITVSTLKYAGFQVAYLCWGVTITTITVALIVFVIGQQLIMPTVRGNFDSFLWLKLLNLWPAVLISLVFFFFQLLMAKYAFLVDKDRTLALDNRRLFHICTYFLFFFNIFLGVVSCLKRILIGALLGVVFLARTQKSVISRDWELKDPGFNAYVGYLLLEHSHANPVLVTFCRLLTKTLNDRAALEMSEDSAKTNHAFHSSSSNNQVSIELGDSSSKRMNQTVRNRWQLLLTLHNNPSLKEHRRSELFVQKSPLTAFGVMIKKGMMPYRVHEEKERENESGVEDIKL
ncbi:Stimulated by retinoic acid gene 6 protein-like [Stylophora pistillata]|uniref:Stimulated by retinoic acid gene 6 protein-like n=2 Tax=Stylophora pistillata TaxID=50429 RepID=A0A2B4RFX2_STYPI|nr:Stimulated by retinoic acid gene 6 protein-like [Stylophora pistillata]